MELNRQVECANRIRQLVNDLNEQMDAAVRSGLIVQLDQSVKARWGNTATEIPILHVTISKHV